MSSDGQGLVQSTSRGMVFRSTGVGRPIVLVHGWCLDGRTWLYQEEALAHGAQTIVPDLPGFGASAGLAGPFTLDRYTDDLQTLLEEFDVANATVVGFAFGALVALAAAGRSGDRIGGVVAIGVPSASTAPYDRMPKAMRRDWPEFARRSARAICKYPPSEATLDWLAEIYGATRLPVALAVLEILGSTEPGDVIESVNVPTLFIHGADDDIVPVAVSQTCAARMADATVEIVEQSGHLVPLDQPGRVSELVQAFAARGTGH